MASVTVGGGIEGTAATPLGSGVPSASASVITLLHGEAAGMSRDGGAVLVSAGRCGVHPFTWRMSTCQWVRHLTRRGKEQG